MIKYCRETYFWKSDLSSEDIIEKVSPKSLTFNSGLKISGLFQKTSKEKNSRQKGAA